MLRQDRQQRLPQKTSEWGRQCEAHHVGTHRGGLDPLPRPPERPVIVRILGEVDGEDDVGSRDRLAVLPAGVGAHVEGIGQAVGRDRPGASQVGHQRAIRASAQQTSK